MTHITCRLTAENRDQLRNPTLGHRVRAAFTFLRACNKLRNRNVNMLASGRTRMRCIARDIDRATAMDANYSMIESLCLDERKAVNSGASYVSQSTHRSDRKLDRSRMDCWDSIALWERKTIILLKSEISRGMCGPTTQTRRS